MPPALRFEHGERIVGRLGGAVVAKRSVGRPVVLHSPPVGVGSAGGRNYRASTARADLEISDLPARVDERGCSAGVSSKGARTRHENASDYR